MLAAMRRAVSRLVLAAGTAWAIAAAGETPRQTVVPLDPGVEQRVEPMAPPGQQRVEAVNPEGAQEVTEGAAERPRTVRDTAAKVLIGVLAASVAVGTMIASLLLL
jgi:hypothetical protein